MEDELTPEQLDRLPRFVQRHISNLKTRIKTQETEIEDLRAIVSAGPDDSTVFASVGDDTDKPLGRDVAVSFKAATDTYTVSLCEDGSLLVDGLHDLVLEPVQTYSIVIRSKEK